MRVAIRGCSCFCAALVVLAGCATGSKKPPADPVAEKILALEARVAEKPDDARAHYDLANAYFDQRRYDDARKSYSRATEIDPAFADAYTNLGLVYRVQGDLNSSIANYRKALSLAPADQVTRKDLIVALQSANQLPAAADQLKELSAQAPDDLVIARQLAALMLQIENFSEAEAAYTRIVGKMPSDADSWYALGICQQAQGKRDAAVASWKHVVSLNRDHAKAYAALADAYTQSGDYDRAWLSVRETQRIGGYVDPKLIARLQDLSGKTGPE